MQRFADISDEEVDAIIIDYMSRHGHKNLIICVFRILFWSRLSTSLNVCSNCIFKEQLRLHLTVFLTKLKVD